MAAGAERPPGSEEALASLQAELREGLESVRASVSTLSDGLHLERQFQQQSLRDVLVAIGKLSGAASQQDMVKIRTTRTRSPPCRVAQLIGDEKFDGAVPARSTGRKRSLTKGEAQATQSVSSGPSSPSHDHQSLSVCASPSVQTESYCTAVSRRQERAETRRSVDWRKEVDWPFTGSVSMTGLLCWLQPLQRRARILLHRRGAWIDIFMGTMIFINSVCIGVEIQNSLEGASSPFLLVLENLFLIFFFLELCLRVLGDDGSYLWSGWFCLDATLICLGMIFTWVVAPILTTTSTDEESIRAMDQILLLRIFRLLRLGRALRLLEFFEEMWKLCNGLIKSAKTVLTACILVLMTTYIFACLGVEAIQTSSALRANPITNEIVKDRFSSLPRMMLTLLSFANGDSIAAVYEPIISEDPYFGIFFALVWLFVTVSLMNLVTAVIVDTAIWQSKADFEQKHLELRKMARKLVPEIENLYDTLDTDNTGYLERSELSLAGVKLKPELNHLIGGDEAKLVDLFNFLDYDMSNTVDKQEFVDGIMHLILQNVPIETTQTLQVLRNQQDNLARMYRDLMSVNRELRRVHNEVDEVCGDVHYLRRASTGNAPAALLSAVDDIASEGPCACPASRQTR